MSLPHLSSSTQRAVSSSQSELVYKGDPESGGHFHWAARTEKFTIQSCHLTSVDHDFQWLTSAETCPPLITHNMPSIAVRVGDDIHGESIHNHSGCDINQYEPTSVYRLITLNSPSPHRTKSPLRYPSTTMACVHSSFGSFLCASRSSPSESSPLYILSSLSLRRANSLLGSP